MNPKDSPPRAALFDMDGTLVVKNTARLFTKMRARGGHVPFPQRVETTIWLLSYFFGAIDAPKIAKKALASYRGMKESEMMALCQALFESSVRDLIPRAAREQVEAHRKRGDLLAIVTASTPYISTLLARELDIPHVVCTELVLDESESFTGAVLPPLCFGEGKTEKLLKLLDPRGISLEHCSFYSDSITDAPLLLSVGDPRVINPDWRLRRLAQKERWPIDRWKL